MAFLQADDRSRIFLGQTTHQFKLFLRALAFGNVVICFENGGAISLGIALRCPARKHGDTCAVAPCVNKFAFPTIVAIQLFVNFLERLRESCL